MLLQSKHTRRKGGRGRAVGAATTPTHRVTCREEREGGRRKHVEAERSGRECEVQIQTAVGVLGGGRGGEMDAFVLGTHKHSASQGRFHTSVALATQRRVGRVR